MAAASVTVADDDGGAAAAPQIPQVEEGAGDAAAFGSSASQLAIAQLLLLHGFAGVSDTFNFDIFILKECRS